MEWYFQPEQQKRYAAVCQTGLKTVLESPDWQEPELLQPAVLDRARST